MLPVAAALLGCAGYIAALVHVVRQDRAIVPMSLLVVCMLFLPAAAAADILQFSGAVPPVVQLVATETVTATLLIAAAWMYRAWVELLCGTWLAAGCTTILGVVVVATMHGELRNPNADVDILGVSLALFTAITIHVGLIDKVPRLRARFLLAAFGWLRAAGWAVEALANEGIGAGLHAAAIALVVGAYVVAAVLVADEALAATPFAQTPPRGMPVIGTYLLIGAAAAGTAVASLLVPAFARWSVLVLVFGSACALLCWQVFTNRRLTQTTLRHKEQEHYIRSILRDSTDVVALCTTRGRLRYVSPAAGHVLHGYGTPDDLEGCTASLVGASREDFAVALEECAATGRSTIEGQRGDQLLEAVLAQREDEVVVSVRDVTERDTMRAHLRELAYSDPLTGLPNRNRLLADLGEVLEGDPTPSDVFVLFVDLDRFKHVNDASGHTVGDAVLAQVAERLRGAAGGGLLARLGGDEFAIVVRGVPRHATRLAGTIVHTLSIPFVVDGRMYQLGASVGVARSEVGIDAEGLLQRADLAMYEAKQQHRPWRLYEPSMSVQVRRLADLDHDLAQEWGPDAVEVYLQPIIDTATFEVSSVEALLRWRRPDGTVEGPASALAFAERTGRFAELTGWILEKVLARIAATPDIRVPIAVNMPPSVLAEAGAAEGLANRVRALGIDPARLQLELTEDAVVEQGEAGLQTLVALHDAGFHLHIDDFGTGFSSLSYLVRLPVDGLKIDRSFITDITTSTTARSVVLGLVSLSQELGIDLIAEGVETREQHEALRSLGVPTAQGFWYGCPESMASVENRSVLTSWATGLRTQVPAESSASGIIRA